MTNSFIIEADYLNGEKSYIQLTSPIVWTDDIDKAQRFQLESDAEYDLNEEFHTIQTTFFKIKIVGIFICKLENNEIIERKQFI